MHYLRRPSASEENGSESGAEGEFTPKSEVYGGLW